MASGTTRQHFFTLNSILCFQSKAFGQLILALVFRPPLHVEDFFFRSHEPFRRPVTLQTPLHLQRRRLIHDRLLVDAPMTRRTTDAFLYVNAVIEVGVIRKVVYADPLEWFATAKTRAHRFEIRTVGPDLLVTIHARRG